MTQHIVRVLYPLALSILLVSCGESKIDGQIFVNNGNETIRLSGADVKIVNREYFSNKTELFVSRFAQLDGELAASSGAAQEVIEDINKIVEVGALIKIRIPKNEHNEWKDEFDRLAKIRLELKDFQLDVAHKREKLRNLELGELFWIDESYGAASSFKADADGRFTINKRLPKDPILLARGRGHHWYHSLENLQPGLMVLDQSNLFGSGCKPCVLETGIELDRIREQVKLAALNTSPSGNYTGPSKDLVNDLAEILGTAKSVTGELARLSASSQDILMQRRLLFGLRGPEIVSAQANLDRMEIENQRRQLYLNEKSAEILQRYRLVMLNIIAKAERLPSVK